LVRSVEERDINTVVRYVYFDAVRKSLAGQVVAAYVRRTGTQLNPFAQGMAASAFGVADPIVNRLITPEALSELLTAGWPVAIDPVVPQGTVGITRNTIGTIWEVYRNSEYGLGRFEVSAPTILPPQQRIGLTFHLLQWRWRLVALNLPQDFQDMLADRLIEKLKAPRTPARPDPYRRADRRREYPHACDLLYTHSF
jgi:hypothetical protein